MQRVLRKPTFDFPIHQSRGVSFTCKVDSASFEYGNFCLGSLFDFSARP